MKATIVLIADNDTENYGRKFHVNLKNDFKIYFKIISNIVAIVMIGIFSIVIVEMLYRPEILLRWNKFCAVFAVVFVIPICMVYLALLAKSFFLFMLLLIVCAMLLIDSYYYN